MSSRWQEEFARLQAFIKANPSIAIDNVKVAIPGEVRPEFYRLFDVVRTTFVEEMFPGLLTEAEIIGENYRRTEREVKELLKVEGILNFGFLDRFLHEPTSELTRPLFTPLFNMIQGSGNPETFEKNGISDIESVGANSLRLGYSKWVALVLVKQLAADKVFTVTPPESKLDGHGEPLCCEMPVAYPEDSKFLIFHHGGDKFPPFITPHFIIHSARLNKYVSFRSEMNKGEYICLNRSENREWYNIASMEREFKDAWHNPSLILYVSADLGDLALIADTDRMCRPDMIVDIREPGDWSDLDTPATAKLYDVLNPIMGHYIISRTSLPVKVSQQNSGEPESPEFTGEGNREAVFTPAVAAAAAVQSVVDPVIVVGFDEAKLQEITQKLSGVEEPGKLAGQEAG